MKKQPKVGDYVIIRNFRGGRTFGKIYLMNNSFISVRLHNSTVGCIYGLDEIYSILTEEQYKAITKS